MRGAPTMPPGSPGAKKAGCLCPRMDNRGGLGIYSDEHGPKYVVNLNCPLHGMDALHPTERSESDGE